MNYSINYLSYNNDDKALKERSIQILDAFFGHDDFTINHEEGQLLFVASGGSEQNAIKCIKDKNNITLLCHRESNSYAACVEIAAYLRENNKRVSLIDVFAPEAFQEFIEIQKVNTALNELLKQKAALIGEVSDWLIISNVEDELVKQKFGIELLRLPWASLDNYQDQEPSVKFFNNFQNNSLSKLQSTAKVYSLLEKVIAEQCVSAISVECFSMVKRDKVTACLPLAVLNKENIVAACEGDICSMLGKMLVRAVAGEIPWQANVAEIKENTVLFAHCTAPLNLLKSFDITTHYETKVGTAIKGKFEKQEVGIFRINNKLDKFMLLSGEIVSTPDYDFACRTQIEVKTSSKEALLLKHKSLGNHHLIFPAKYVSLLARMMGMLQVEQVE